MHYTTSCNTQSSAPENEQNNFPKHFELTGIINKLLLLHVVGCLCYLYQRCTVKQISDNEIYLLIKYIKGVLWRVAKRLSYIEDARCLKVKPIFSSTMSNYVSGVVRSFTFGSHISLCTQLCLWFRQLKCTFLIVYFLIMHHQIVSSPPLCYTNFRRKENIRTGYSKGIKAFVWSLQGKREVHLLSNTLTPPARPCKSGLWPASLSHS